MMIMKTNVISGMLIVLGMLVFSCQKDDSLEEGGAGNGATGAGFFYAENGSTTLLKADEASAQVQYKTIIAKKDNKTLVEMVLPDLKPGTYSLAARYAFSYVKLPGVWESSAGTVTITKNEGGKLSGTFDASAGSGITGVTSVTGKFNDLPVK